MNPALKLHEKAERIARMVSAVAVMQTDEFRQEHVGLLFIAAELAEELQQELTPNCPETQKETIQ